MPYPRLSRILAELHLHGHSRLVRRNKVRKAIIRRTNIVVWVAELGAERRIVGDCDGAELRRLRLHGELGTGVWGMQHVRMDIEHCGELPVEGHADCGGGVDCDGRGRGRDAVGRHHVRCGGVVVWVAELGAERRIVGDCDGAELRRLRLHGELGTGGWGMQHVRMDIWQ